MTEVLELTRELLRLRSITPEDAGCSRLVLNYLGPEVKATWFNFEDTNNIFFTHGSGSPHLMFLGHVDVVPPGDEKAWTTDPFEPSEREGKLFARGACDMKGAVAAMAVAIKRFISQSPEHIGTISLLLTSDEEGSNVNGIPKVVEAFAAKKLKIDYCLVGEPSSQQAFADAIKVGRRGTLSGKISILGVQGHIAYPQLADNPIHRFTPILTKLCEHKWDNGDEFFEPTSLQFSNISAGTGATNVIPAKLEAKFNFRFTPQQTPDSLMQEFEQFLVSAGVKFEIEWTLGGLPFLTKGGLLLDTLQSVIQSKLGITPRLETGGGTSDGRFIAPLGTQVIEFGPRGESLHKVDEFVRIEELEPLAEIFQEVASKILIVQEN